MSLHKRRVVITGMGLITPLGVGVAENWKQVKSLRTGLAHYPRPGLPKSLQYMGRVRDVAFDTDVPHKLLGQMKFLNRGSLLGFAAAREALLQARIDHTAVPPERKALFIASGDTTKVGYDFMYPAVKDGTLGKWKAMDYEKLNHATLDKVNPFFLLESIMNNLFSFLSAFLECMGPNTSLASHSPCGGDAIELACRSINQGTADTAIAVGCGNWITDIPLYELDGLGILSQCRDGIHSYRPFDRRRDGFIPGEGGAALFMEALESAQERKATILGELKGFGNCAEFSGDQGLSVPPQVSARSIALALEEAGCSLQDLSFICPHGSGSQKGDRSELISIKRLYTEGKDYAVPLCGMKPYTGHLGAASDIAEVIFGIAAIADRTVPATLNFTQAEKEFSELKISGSPEPCTADLFLSTSYGIGGQSSSILVQGTA